VYRKEDKTTGADKRVGEEEIEEIPAMTVKYVTSFTVLSLKNAIRFP
jgi:hypothetical protein